MKGVLVGAWHSKGFSDLKDDNGNVVQADKPYDNFVVLLQKPLECVQMEKHEKDWVCGFTTVEAKCPWEKRFDIFDGAITDMNELNYFVGTQVSYFFDDKKKIDTILL